MYFPLPGGAVGMAFRDGSSLTEVTNTFVVDGIMDIGGK